MTYLDLLCCADDGGDGDRERGRDAPPSQSCPSLGAASSKVSTERGQEPVTAGVPVRAGQEGWQAGRQSGAQGRVPSAGGLVPRRVLPGMQGW